MKKIALLLVLVLIFTLTACVVKITPSDPEESTSAQASGNTDTAGEETPQATGTPTMSDADTETPDSQTTAQVTQDPAASPSPSSDSSSDGDADAEETFDLYSATLEIQSYFPMQGDVHLIYAGTGNEFAPYERYVDYIGSGKIQYRNESDATISAIVYVNEDGMLKKVLSVGEEYYRTNLLDTRNMDEILLKAPVELGKTWTAKAGETRTITAVDMSVTVPYGTFDAVEVTVSGDSYTTKEYYAPGAGLIKTEYYFGEVEEAAIVTELTTVEFKVPYSWPVTLYYPDFQTDGPVYVEQTVDFYTGNNPGVVLGEALKSVPDSSALDATIPQNASILGSYYDSETGIVTVDLSANFISELNLGAAYEGTVLTCIANTFSRFYCADLVSITIDGGPYESGHYYFGSGDYVSTDFENVSPL